MQKFSINFLIGGNGGGGVGGGRSTIWFLLGELHFQMCGENSIFNNICFFPAPPTLKEIFSKVNSEL